MPIKKRSIVLFLLSATVTVSAQEWSGTISSREVNFPLPLSGPVNSNLNPTEVNLMRESTFGNAWQTKVHLVGVADPSNNSPVEQYYADLPEFYIAHRQGSWIWKLGSDIFNWGVTDGDNPMDVVNTKIYFDPVHTRKMGAGALQASWSGESSQVDLIYIPIARSPQLPGGNSRWLPRQVYIGQQASGSAVELLLPNSFTYNYNAQTPQLLANQNNVAARWMYHSGGWEIGFYGYEGLSPLPLVTPVVTATPTSVYPISIYQISSAVTLQTQDFRQEVSGFSFVRSFSSFQLKGEVAYTVPEGSALAIRGTQADSVLALEKTWNVGENGSLVTILEYGSSEHGQSSSNDISSLSHFFDNNWMGVLRGTYRDTETFTVFYANDQEYYSWVLDASYEHHWTDNWKSTFEAVLIDGPPNSPLGSYAANKNYSVSLEWAF